MALLGFTEFYWVSYGFTGFYRVLLGFTGFHMVLLGFTGFYRVLPGFIRFYWVLLGFTGFYWVLPGFTGFYWFFTGFYWVLRLWWGGRGPRRYTTESRALEAGKFARLLFVLSRREEVCACVVVSAGMSDLVARSLFCLRSFFLRNKKKEISK